MIVVFVASYATSLGNLPWHSAELFPLEIRGLGSSLLTASCWACNILISATFLSLLNGAGASPAFGICTFAQPNPPCRTHASSTLRRRDLSRETFPPPRTNLVANVFSKCGFIFTYFCVSLLRLRRAVQGADSSLVQYPEVANLVGLA